MSKKYCIEGNIDFYSEINSNEGNNDCINYDKICLITNEPLIDKFVTMECGHKFNYIPLYNDLIKQKYFTNVMEESRLKINEIRCPYCRSISTQLIPFYDNFCIMKDVFVRKIVGVNNYNFIEKNDNSYNNFYYREKSLWVCEKLKIEKYTKQQFKHDVKEAKLKAREEKLKAQEEKLKAKEEKLKAKEEVKQTKLKAKEEKLRVKEEVKQTKLKAKEEKLRAQEERTNAK